LPPDLSLKTPFIKTERRFALYGPEVLVDNFAKAGVRYIPFLAVETPLPFAF
jgi:hypothetical protein